MAKVVVADDDCSELKGMESILKSAGREVVCQARRAARHGRPAVPQVSGHADWRAMTTLPAESHPGARQVRACLVTLANSRFAAGLGPTEARP